ncbi:Neurotransmitter-gated ion-channel ligand binding domain protein [Oesophagostomum dentatum]|uniref:Neurotransmitter-gated ion-channel ligand binding domain protein n=1 Tax=Oesophagostomum dentatum TaxID=61180 RepID=A0A0B1THY2_OESDE|nr:Neurotransmitter-gated ion-channel ligand binding domain protein [Oesophagostomum dentatum]
MLLLTSILSIVRSIPLNVTSEQPAGPYPSTNLTGEHRYTDEQRLLYHLLRDYEKAVRPVRNASDTVTVRLGMTMTNIFDMDERNQVLTINVWLDQEWNDELLRWNPDDFGGIKSIRIPCDLIWLPDIVLYNNADDYTAGYMRSRAMILYTGTVFWPPPTQLRSTCKGKYPYVTNSSSCAEIVDVSLFPFDEQKCSLKFGSWTYHGFQVDVTNRSENIDLTNYVPSGEFELVKVLNFHHRGPFNEPVPQWARVLVLQRLRRLLRMKLPQTEIDPARKSSICPNNRMMRRLSVRVAMDEMRNEIINEIGPDLLNGGTTECLHGLLLDVPSTNLTVDSNGVTRKRRRDDDHLQAKMLRTLQILIKRQENEDESERLAVEWRQVAQVLDRLLFWVFLIATATITFVLLLLIPAIHRSSYEEELE